MVGVRAGLLAIGVAAACGGGWAAAQDRRPPTTGELYRECTADGKRLDDCRSYLQTVIDAMRTGDAIQGCQPSAVTAETVRLVFVSQAYSLDYLALPARETVGAQIVGSTCNSGGQASK